MKSNINLDNNLKKVLIIGSNGFLGSNFFTLDNRKEIVNQNLHFIASSLHNSILDKTIPFYRIDITNKKDTIKKITKISPNFVILTAAMTNVDQCEIDKELATKINVNGPENVIKACKKINSKLVFISTDFVFDGEKEGGYYNETDQPKPLSYYAMTKLKAELAIINSGIEYLICRTAVLYGWNERKLNFITWILNNLKQNKEISIVKSQINSPTFVINLAQIILKLIEKNVEGIFHTAGNCALSRYDMALKSAETFNYNKNIIIPIKSLTQKAIRPKNVSLDISKLKKVIGSELKIYNFEDGLNYMKQQIAV